MKSHLKSLFSPKSIAVVGGGGWCQSVIENCHKLGFEGKIAAVHPTKAEIAGVLCVRTIDDLPFAPDACFIGINRKATIGALKKLCEVGAKGAVCFASGFLESAAETVDGAALQDELLEAAGDMAVIGPNCYGFINYLDGAGIWPDQHGGVRVSQGVAVLTQSSNIALNISMQKRGLPLAFLGTVGNQAQIGLSQIGQALLEDPRITALGLHIEGIDDVAAFQDLAKAAKALNKTIVALKVGASENAQAATISHTASLAGSQAGAIALLERLGIAQVDSLTQMIESLKLFHLYPRLPSKKIASLSCSGGEASLIADSAVSTKLTFPSLNKRQHNELRSVLGPNVALANPLDYNTYIWGDFGKLSATFKAMLDPELGMMFVILDFPRSDRCDGSEWGKTVEALDHARIGMSTPVALVASLPENLPEGVARDLMARGIVPFCGLNDALRAVELATTCTNIIREPTWFAKAPTQSVTLSEHNAKTLLATFGMQFPQRVRIESASEVEAAFNGIGCNQVVLKGEGVAHKTESGAVCMNLTTASEIQAAMLNMTATSYLLEEQVEGAELELLVGVVRDPVHGFILTLALGGVWTELFHDHVALLLPVAHSDIQCALKKLKVWPILNGYRGKPPLFEQGIVKAVVAIQDLVFANLDTVEEVEVNPLLVGENFAIAVDALIQMEVK